MRVKAVREHKNRYGDQVKKTVGTVYDLPDNQAKTLIAAGLVAEFTAEDAAATNLADKSKAELQAIAADAGVAYADSDTKAALIEKIEQARSEA